MFSISLASDSSNYDFEKEENAVKWKGVFVNPLRKVIIASACITLLLVICE